MNPPQLMVDDNSLELNTPRDKYQLIYLVFILHGIGVLMPWNMFITANDYFTKYKLDANYTGHEENTYKTSFLQYLCFASQIPNITFHWLNVFVQIRGHYTARIVWGISAETIIFVFTIILAMVDSSSWPGTFFWLTMVSVVLLNMANGIYQNTLFGMAAKLPPRYIGALILGNNICGTFTAVVSILSTFTSSNHRIQAIYFFITALFVLLVCFDSYFALPINRYYTYHQLRKEEEAELLNGEKDTISKKIPYFRIFRQALPQLVNVFLVFFVTLSLFPAVQANIKKYDKNFFLSDKLFASITCFLTFNVFAMLGSLTSTYLVWPPPKYLFIAVNLRLLYIPFYLFCNYQLDGISRSLPVYIKNDWLYWIVGMTMGFTSGYFSSVGLQYVPNRVEPEYASVAGMFGAAVLMTGIFAGVLSAFIWPYLLKYAK